MTTANRSTSIPMGEIAVARQAGELRTLLGSCLGLALYDWRLKVGGIAHIVLPNSLGKREHPGKFADTAIPAMIRDMQQLAVNEPLRLQAKIAGGANMFVSTSSAQATIGEQNVKAVECILGDLRIPLIGRHCGGEQGRRMILDTATGLVTIHVVGAETATI